MSTYYQAAARRHRRDARAGLIPNGWSFQPGSLEDWAADQLGSLYEPADAIVLARELKGEGYALTFTHCGQRGHLIQSDSLPDPISSLLP